MARGSSLGLAGTHRVGCRPHWGLSMAPRNTQVFALLAEGPADSCCSTAAVAVVAVVAAVRRVVGAVGTQVALAGSSAKVARHFVAASRF